MSKPNTHTAQYLDKWHAGFNVDNLSFVLQAFEGTEEEAKWYAEMLEKAFAKLRVVEEVEYSRVAIHMVGPHAYRCGGCGKSYRIAGNRIDGSDEYYEWGFCPGCGNPIKR